MRRGRTELKRIEKEANRQVTFSKRRSGLLKKANELSVLCDAQVALIVISAKGKLYEFSSNSTSMDDILERYERHSRTAIIAESNNEFQGDLSLELFRLTAQVEVLEKKIRNYEGRDLYTLSLRELQSLECQVDAALRRIRTKKNQLLNESILEMQRKAKMLEVENTTLEKKVKEKGKQKLVTEGRRQKNFDRSLFNFDFCPLELSPLPQQEVSALTLGGPSQAGGTVAEAEAGNAPSCSIVMPPWMLHHLTR